MNAGPGAKVQTKRKTICQLRKILLNQELGPRLDWNILVWIKTKLWSTASYALYLELTRQKTKRQNFYKKLEQLIRKWKSKSALVLILIQVLPAKKQENCTEMHLEGLKNKNWEHHVNLYESYNLQTQVIFSMVN